MVIFSSYFRKTFTWRRHKMKKIAFVLAALAAIAFALPATTASAKEMKHKHHHHHHMMKKMDKKM